MDGLLLAPALLSRRVPRHRPSAEFGLLALTVLTLSLLIYTDAPPASMALARPLPYLIFPPFIWAAVRLSPSATAQLLLLHGLVGLFCTTLGLGPFAPDLAE